MKQSNTALVRCQPCVGGPAADFQDKKYGYGMRIANISPGKNPKDSMKKASCTCCGASQFVGEGNMR